MIKITAVKGQKEISIVAALAEEIWNDHFVPIIGKAQVDYMLDKFQSESAISKQIDEGFEYYLLCIDGDNSGYIGLVPDPAESTLMISKIYVKKNYRGFGVGSEALGFIEEICRKRGLKKIFLTVNKYNASTIQWYLKKGFIKAYSEVKDIGGGFVMDDYIMEKSC